MAYFSFCSYNSRDIVDTLKKFAHLTLLIAYIQNNLFAIHFSLKILSSPDDESVAEVSGSDPLNIF